MKVTKQGIAKRISDLLEDRDMTIADLHIKSGVGFTKLKMICSDSPDVSGKKRLPNTDEIIDIANALNVSPYYLLTGIEDENHDFCEELGLSNNTVEVLKKQHLYYPQNQLVQIFDLLAENVELVSYLYQYLTTDYNKAHVLLSENEYDEAISSQKPFNNLYPIPSETWDATILLAVVTAIKTTKEKIMSERKKRK